MKRFAIITVLALAGALVFALPALSHNNSAPNMECTACHQGGPGQAAVSIEGLPASYKPGGTYDIKVTVSSQTKSLGNVQGGFALQASEGEIVVTDKKHTQVVDGFLTHTQEGSEARSWSFKWKAPKKGGEASLLVMAMAANGDFSPVGDDVGSSMATSAPGK